MTACLTNISYIAVTACKRIEYEELQILKNLEEGQSMEEYEEYDPLDTQKFYQKMKTTREQINTEVCHRLMQKKKITRPVCQEQISLYFLAL